MPMNVFPVWNSLHRRRCAEGNAETVMLVGHRFELLKPVALFWWQPTEPTQLKMCFQAWTLTQRRCDADAICSRWLVQASLRLRRLALLFQDVRESAGCGHVTSRDQHHAGVTWCKENTIVGRRPQSQRLAGDRRRLTLSRSVRFVLIRNCTRSTVYYLPMYQILVHLTAFHTSACWVFCQPASLFSSLCAFSY